MVKSLIVLSGGLDSTTLLYDIIKSPIPNEVQAIHFQYGSSHNKKEMRVVRRICELMQVQLHTIPLSFMTQFDSALIDGKIPEGRYNEEVMRKTVVPFRNGIMLSIAAGFAESMKFNNVYIGTHAGDHFIYPDCRPDFNKSMSQAILKGTSNGVKLVAPYQDIDKTAIIRKGIKLGVPYELTWTCYAGGNVPCGKCGSCDERASSFAKLNKKDPLLCTR